MFDAGRFHLQMSLRERPTLRVVALAMKPQAYFGQLEFDLFEVRSLPTIEMIAEKVRAAFQRAKVRDLYDLHRFATTPFDGELLRRLVVLKLWQVRDRFVPDSFFAKLRGGDYEWEDIQRLVRASDRVDPAEIIAVVEDLVPIDPSHDVLATRTVSQCWRSALLSAAEPPLRWQRGPTVRALR
jgi:hypothetical protein